MIKKMTLLILKTLKIVFKSIVYVFNSIKFIFSFPLLSLASSAFSFFILLFLENIINLILPLKLQVGFVETIIGAIIFIVLKYLLFNDKLLHNDDFNYNKYLYSFLPTFIIWIIPLLWLDQGMGFEVTTLSEVNIFYLAFYFPHMWLATLTGEFFFSSIVGMALNVTIFFIVGKITIKKVFNNN